MAQLKGRKVIVRTSGRSLYALVWGLFISRWVLATVGKSELGLYGEVGGMTVIMVAAFTMRLLCGGIAAAWCSSMGTDPSEGNYYGNLMQQ